MGELFRTASRSGIILRSMFDAAHGPRSGMLFLYEAWPVAMQFVCITVAASLSPWALQGEERETKFQAARAVRPDVLKACATIKRFLPGMAQTLCWFPTAGTYILR